MTQVRPSQRYLVAVTAVLAFVTLGLSVPIFVGGRTQSLTIQNATVQAAARDVLAITSPITLSSEPGLTLERGQLSITRDKTGRPLTGDMVTRLLASNSARLTLEDATLVLDIDGESRAAPDADVALLAAPLIAALRRLEFESVAIRRGVIVLRRSSGTSEILSDVRVDVGLKRGTAVTVNGSFELQGRQLALDATLGLQSDQKDAVRLPLKVSVKGSLVEASITDGRLLVGKTLKLMAPQAEVTSPSIRSLAQWLGTAWPGERGFGPFRAKGRLDWVDRMLTFQDAAFAMDGNEATGTMVLKWGQQNPEVGGTLALKRLDLAPYLESAPPASKSAALLHLGWLWPGGSADSAAFGVPLIKHVDADVRISAERLLAGRASFGRSAASLSVKGGKLLADIAEIDVGDDASARGQVMIDMGSAVPRYGVRGKFEAIDASAFAKALVDHPVASGRSNVVFDLTSNGETAEQVAGRVSGKIGVEMTEGGSLGLDVLQLFSGLAKVADGEGWGPSARGSTPFKSLSARMTLNSGVALADAVRVEFADRLLTAVGTLDNRARSVNADFSLVRLPSPAASAVGARDVAAERVELLTARGPWASPAFRYSTRPARSSTAPTFNGKPADGASPPPRT